VLDRSLRQQHEWRQAGDDIRIAVNLSPANLMDTRLPSDIASLLERYDTPAHLLELEITETTLMRDPERAMDILARISELGVEFALDDYGTGYSSLAQLRRLPVRSLKIDKSFVMDMTENESDANIVRSTIQLGRSLNLRVVAEGVETVEHLHALKEYGCHIARGYLMLNLDHSNPYQRHLRARPGRSRARVGAATLPRTVRAPWGQQSPMSSPVRLRSASSRMIRRSWTLASWLPRPLSLFRMRESSWMSSISPSRLLRSQTGTTWPLRLITPWTTPLPRRSADAAAICLIALAEGIRFKIDRIEAFRETLKRVLPPRNIGLVSGTQVNKHLVRKGQELRFSRWPDAS
jgi:EAL domain-containing protein (putative c-di-GMP-specific phosphodiesterase class I)